ncbi:hypothetical protein PYW07_006807 [Mythimna separata]|uniref:Phospholipid scramblase n=1 Tax=Mythimna separata TaxID=271217 RepID=A0AAD7Z2X0_MYTSE|nr:hypothetical protein PYW07_006807 [Mythimna separata]
MAAAISLATEPALQRLLQLSTVYMTQTSTGYNGSNFSVFGQDEQLLFNLNEFFTNFINHGSARRAFQFNGEDSTGKKLFSFNRPQGSSITINDEVQLFMDDALISIIRLARTLSTPIFNINDAHDGPVIRIKGFGVEGTIFQLQTNDKTAIGSIQKKFRGWKEELSSQKDAYIINFPADLAVTFKIAVIVTCVYIDFRFHEGK